MQQITLSFNQDIRLLGEWLASLRAEPPRRQRAHCAYYWEGALDVGVLQQALDALAARHEALRTIFPDPAAVPPKVAATLSRRLGVHDVFASSLFSASVSESATCTLRIHDELIGHRADDRAFIEAIQRVATEPIAAGSSPTFSAWLFRLSPSSGVLLLGMHSLIIDLWSARLLERDLGTLYRRCAGDSSAQLPPLELQYSDFSARQRRQIVSGEFDAAIAYWTERWQQFFPERMSVDDLGLRRPGQPTASRARAETLTIDGPLDSAIRAYVIGARATLYMFWLCALCILFHVYSGRRRIAVFGNTAGRTLAQTQNVLGWFANSNVVGIEVSPDESAADTLVRVRTTALMALEWEALPIGALWASFMKTGRFEELARGEWIAMNFAEHRRVRAEHWGVDGLIMRPFDVGLATRSATAVNIGILNRGDRFVLSCDYRADLDAEGIRSLLRNWRNVAAAFVADPHAPLTTFNTAVEPHVAGQLM